MIDSVEHAQQQLQIVTDSMSAPVARCSRDLRYLWVSRSYAGWLGRSADEIIGRPIIEVLGAQAFEKLRHRFERVLTGVQVRYEEPVDFAGLGRRWINAVYTPTLDATGVADGWVAVVNDITERKQLEAALRESEERFGLMADAAPVLIWISGTDKLCKWFNKPWLQFVGRSMEEELGTGWSENVHSDDFDHCLHTYASAFEARQPFTMEYRLRRHDGEYRWILDNGVPRYGSSGEFAGYIGSCIDISDRRQAEEEIRRLNRELQQRIDEWQTVVNMVPVGIGIAHDPDCRTITHNPYISQLLGVPAWENGSLSTPDAPPEYAIYRDGKPLSADELPMQLACRGLEVRNFECDLVRQGQPPIRLICFARPLRDAEGRIRGSVGASLDISSRVSAEHALQQLNAELDQRVQEQTDELRRGEERLRALAVQLTNAEQRERRRLATVLHDHVQQILVASKMRAGALEDFADDQVRSSARMVTNLLDQAIDATRSLSRELVPLVLYERGLRPALEWLAKQMEEQHNLLVRIQADSDIDPADENLRELLFQIARELLLNVIKHAETEVAWIDLRQSDEEVTLAVRDLGEGFKSSEPVNNGDSFGLFHIRERLRPVRGRLEIDSGRGTGARVTITVP